MIYKDFIENEIENIVFIELKEDAVIDSGVKEYSGYLPLPIRSTSLLEIVEDNLDNINISDIEEGMLIVASIKPEYKYRDIYLEFLHDYYKNFKNDLYSLAYKKYEEENYLDVAIILNLLIDEGFEDERILFTLANTLEKFDISGLKADDRLKFAIEIMNLYEKSVNYDEDFTLAHYKIGYIYKEFSQFVKAKKSFEKVIEKEENDLRVQEARNNLDEIESEILKEEAVVLIESGKYDEALEKLSKVNVEKRDDLYFYHLSLVYTNLEDYEGALESIENAIEIEDIKAYHNQKAIIYQYLGESEKAKKELEDAIDRLGPDYYLNVNLGTMYYNEGNLEAAIGNFEIANEIEPNDELRDLIYELRRDF